MSSQRSLYRPNRLEKPDNTELADAPLPHDNLDFLVEPNPDIEPPGTAGSETAEPGEDFFPADTPVPDLPTERPSGGPNPDAPDGLNPRTA